MTMPVYGSRKEAARQPRIEPQGVQAPVTLTPGQTFYEGPDDIHVVSRNASTTKPAKFLVFFVKQRGAPATVPAK